MKRILVIEDDTIMRENIEEILKLAHYEVTTANNGKMGSILAKEILPDLIICDIMMPQLDGYGVLHVLSKDPKTASIPFIFMSAKAERNEIRKGMELGADDYITKPFEDTELLNAIESRLKNSALFKKEYVRNLNGLNHFLEEASGLYELKELLKSRPVSNYKKREVIFHLGDTPHYVYFLNKGSIKTYKTHDVGKEFITNIYKQGEFFGHVPLFEERNYADSALVLEDSELYKIPKSDFLCLINKNRDVAGQFIKLLSNQIEEQEKQLLSLAYDTVRKRTAEALLQLVKQSSDKKQLHSIRVTREDLASLAGTASETVIRCLGEFKEDKLIEVNGREIIIINPQGLKKIQ